MNSPARANSLRPARDRILDAAEFEFSESGFAGAGMKAIATRADVAQGLLHYHFANKDGLYAAVIARRSEAINAERIKRLTGADTAAPDAVEQIMEALLAPPLGPAGGGRAYARVFSGLLVGGEREARLVEELYDPVARVFIDALSRACPDAPPHAVSWAYHHAIGALMAAVARNGRPERLAGGEEAADTGTTVARLVRFAAGGFRAAVAAETGD